MLRKSASRLGHLGRLSADLVGGSSRPSVAARDISVDLAWIDLLKGVAIIGVFLDNWLSFMSPRDLSLGFGTFVQVFFVLSGFGLTIDYYRRRDAVWSWRSWAWRRIAKIIVPYQLAVIFSFALGLLAPLLYPGFSLRSPLADYATHVVLAQNFFPESHFWNSPLWFMPVIVGLYLGFPVLVRILERFGPTALLLSSLAVTYGTLIAARSVGIRGGHSADVFTYWLFTFALGMLLAYVRQTQPTRLRLLVGYPALLIGIGFMVCSWGLRNYVPQGRVFNDPITSIGISLVLLNLVWSAQRLVPSTARHLTALSERSFLMYLVHVPIIHFVIGPLISMPTSMPTDLVVLIGSGLLYVALVFLFTKPLLGPVNRLTATLTKRPAG